MAEDSRAAASQPSPSIERGSTQADGAPPRAPKRAYQACNPCRKRKARCMREERRDGTFDDSCVRCKRERKQCVFTAERSEKPTRHGRAFSTQNQSLSPSQRSARGLGQDRTNSKETRTFQPPVPRHGSAADLPTSAVAQPQFGSTGGDLTERVAHTVVSNQTDALNLLFEAADGYHRPGHGGDEPERDGTSIYYEASHGASTFATKQGDIECMEYSWLREEEVAHGPRGCDIR